MSAYDQFVSCLREYGCTVDDKGDRGSASTPGHGSSDRGTMFRRYPDGVLVWCFNQDREEMLTALGLTMADLFDSPRTSYRYADGRTVTRSYRDGKKTFSQSGTRSGRALFNIDNPPTDQDSVVYVVEGEKDVRAATAVGVFAVSQAQGARTSPERADWSPLRGRRVVVVQDKDDVGRARAKAVAKLLVGTAASVAIVEAREGKDLADHIAAGLGIGELVPVPWQASASSPVDPVVGFWSARPVLAHVLEFARARRAGPWGTLGVVLARAVAAVPPTVTLPATVGGRMSLNLFTALVGPSGSGKGACEAAARDALVCCYDPTGRVVVDVPEFPLGSGEGIARSFRPAGADDDAPNLRDRAVFTAPEVDTMKALFARTGATLEAELRKLYSGEQIGFNNAQKTTRTVVSAHSYRACLVVGAQPLRAGALLDGADGGTPQRFLWLPVADPDAPDQAPAEPAVWKVRLRDWQPGPLPIPDVARQEIDAARLARLRGGTDEAETLDGHGLLSRLKVAAALMVLDGRTVIDAQDWALAGVVMAVSDGTRASVQRAATEQKRRANHARALASAEREEILSDRKFQRARNSILRSLTDGPAGRSPLRRRMKEDIRANFDAALSDLLDSGQILESGPDSKPVYTLSTDGPESPGTHPGNPALPAEIL
ncbi:hypothetical protein [Nocardia sp. alder85J]|uniref:hypothetical protein n=1 Tax=Nocardia sp. alder85J TaxID=2862949 RepID=UPI001CD60944|nr:hypothetical protein [Nocardia sp. alder85J]MCX4096536.1 hypothetical protein [Nocardia sp. alder85J]